MREVDHLAGMILMAMITNIGLKQRSKDGMVREAFEFADEFMKQAKQREEAERKIRTQQLRGE